MSGAGTSFGDASHRTTARTTGLLRHVSPTLHGYQGGVRLVLAGLTSPARARVDSYDLSAVLADDRFCPTLTAAVDDYRARFGASWQSQVTTPTKDMT
jgi:hypothetical protein